MAKIGVVSHDAGGAEILSNWLLTDKENSHYFHLSGPAIKIFKKNIGTLNTLTLNQLVENCDSLICGTSWQSDFELQAIQKFQNEGKHTIAFLDHWVNYRQRFLSNNNIILPNEIWTADDYAETLAKSYFPEIPIKKKANVYLKKLKEKFLLQSEVSDEKTILYVCEPIREHALKYEGDERYWGYTEEEALEFFLDNFSLIVKGKKKIVVRPHPSENPNKYNWVLEREDIDISIGGSQTLYDEINKSAAVVGCESMAMVIGLIAGKLVLSSIPPSGRKCQLPHKEILLLSELVERGAKVEI